MFKLLVIGIVVVLIIITTGYVKAPTDKAYVITGLRKEPKYVIGKASFRIPYLQRLDRLELKMISVDVKTKESVPTNEYINVNVDSAVKIKISTKPDMLKMASENFLNRDEKYIIDAIVDVLEGNIREIIGQMKLEELVTDRKSFAEKVQENAAPDMKKMGLEIVAFNVQNITDEQGVIENLGIDRIVSISKSAAISRAESERDIAVAKAKAEKEANDARVEAETEVARKNNELAIQKSELQKMSDIKKAEADATYQIQEQEQRKTIEIMTANANIAAQEKEIELKAKAVEVTERTLEAEIKKKAEAEKFRAQQNADAELYVRQKEAEAKKFESLQEAEALKAKAEADLIAKEKEADGIRARGLAEAEAIRAKSIAEAEGIDKKADAMKKYGEAAVLEMYFKALPEVAANIAKPLENVESITMYGEGNNAKMVEDITTSMNQVFAGASAGAGVDIKALLSSFIGGRIASNKINDKNDEVCDINVTKEGNADVDIFVDDFVKED